jgi:predicted transcriptional regulator
MRLEAAWFVKSRAQFISLIVSFLVLTTVFSALWLSFGHNSNGFEERISEQMAGTIAQNGHSAEGVARSMAAGPLFELSDFQKGLPLETNNQSWGEGDNETLMRTPVHADNSLQLYIITLLSVIVGLSVVLVFSWPIEILAVPLLSTLVMVYVRFVEKDPLDNYRRGLIHGFVLAHPGVSFSELKRGLELANGSLVYHIHILEKEGLVHSRRAGNLVLYYSSDADPKKLSESRWTELQLRILKSVAEAGEIGKSDLRLKVGCSHQLLHYNLKRMVADEVLIARFQYGRKYYALGPGYDVSAIAELLARKQGDRMASEDSVDVSSIRLEVASELPAHSKK